MRLRYNYNFALNITQATHHQQLKYLNCLNSKYILRKQKPIELTCPKNTVKSKWKWKPTSEDFGDGSEMEFASDIVFREWG